MKALHHVRDGDRDGRVREAEIERQGGVCMSLGHWDKWGHRRGLISSSLVFTPWRKRRRRWRWGCVSTLVVNETSLRSFVFKWQRGGRSGWVCVWGVGARGDAVWCLKKVSERGGSPTAGEQGDRWERERGRCEASVIRAQRASYWTATGEAGRRGRGGVRRGMGDRSQPSKGIGLPACSRSGGAAGSSNPDH